MLTKKECIVGEKYIVEFDKERPSANRIRLDKPIFLDDEKTSVTEGIVTEYNPNYFRQIVFIYTVNDVEYEKWYEPDKDVEKIFLNLKIGKKYYIKYLTKNPQRAIILLNSPLPKVST